MGRPLLFLTKVTFVMEILQTEGRSLFGGCRWGATSHNVQPLLAPNNCRYCSAFYEPESECVDAFSVDWANEINWCFPPYRLIGRTILHLLDCGAQGTLIAPYWAHGAFWPLLFPSGAGAKAGAAVLEVQELGAGHEVLGFPEGSTQGSLTQRLIVAIRVDGRRDQGSRARPTTRASTTAQPDRPPGP